MFRLRTLGGLGLDREGTPVEGCRGQLLAALAFAAVSDARGVTRDQLLGALWAEVELERGRHALSQALYSLRKQLGVDAVVTDGQLVRLDSAVMTTDLAEFRVFHRECDWERAARLYAGPFLDGFYLDDAPAFNRWVDETRDQLRVDGERAIEQWAEATDRSGNWAESRAALHRLTALDPLNSRYAHSYMLALAKSGDRGGAVRHGQGHVATLRSELGSAPSTRLAELLDRLQRGTFDSAVEARIRNRPPS